MMLPRMRYKFCYFVILGTWGIFAIIRKYMSNGQCSHDSLLCGSTLPSQAAVHQTTASSSDRALSIVSSSEVKPPQSNSTQFAMPTIKKNTLSVLLSSSSRLVNSDDRPHSSVNEQNQRLISERDLFTYQCMYCHNVL